MGVVEAVAAVAGAEAWNGGVVESEYAEEAEGGMAIAAAEEEEVVVVVAGVDEAVVDGEEVVPKGYEVGQVEEDMDFQVGAPVAVEEQSEAEREEEGIVAGN